MFHITSLSKVVGRGIGKRCQICPSKLSQNKSSSNDHWYNYSKPFFSALPKQAWFKKPIFGLSLNDERSKTPVFSLSLNDEGAKTPVFGLSLNDEGSKTSVFGLSLNDEAIKHHFAFH